MTPEEAVQYAIEYLNELGNLDDMGAVDLLTNSVEDVIADLEESLK